MFGKVRKVEAGSKTNEIRLGGFQGWLPGSPGFGLKVEQAES